MNKANIFVFDDIWTDFNEKWLIGFLRTIN